MKKTKLETLKAENEVLKVKIYTAKADYQALKEEIEEKISGLILEVKAIKADSNYKIGVFSASNQEIRVIRGKIAVLLSLID